MDSAIQPLNSCDQISSTSQSANLEKLLTASKENYTHVFHMEETLSQWIKYRLILCY